MFKFSLSLNAFAISTTLSHFPFPFSLKFLTTTATSNSFAVSYFINKFNFSPEFALKASKQVRFNSSQKPDSVLNFFTTHGFTDTDMQNIIKREPWLLNCDTHKRVLPKFQFLLSKGASPSDIVRMVSGSPRFMKLSLDDRVIPTYNSISKFLCSDQNAIASIISCPSLLSSKFVTENVKLLVNHGVENPSIFRIIHSRANVICSNPFELEKTLQELKIMGFDPSKSYFADALLAMRCISKSKWNEKIDAYKKWGWSEETIKEMVSRQPKCMLVSIDKINRVMEFWVNQLGWDDSYLVMRPGIFAYSLENRVIPRAVVVRYLLSKGLMNENASLTTAFFMSEKLFIEKYVECFEVEEASQVLKLYREKMNVEDKIAKDNLNISCL
ncbi:transcription termination factor MTERF15, mitochondrial-like [Cicer arietinum]|uniref:transcription termination factor MTERF15, mitochondrial-like n=1 Tax=Cicer arietinum TaxID=3827 RepID=UPI00032A9864